MTKRERGLLLGAAVVLVLVLVAAANPAAQARLWAALAKPSDVTLAADHEAFEGASRRLLGLGPAGYAVTLPRARQEAEVDGPPHFRPLLVRFFAVRTDPNEPASILPDLVSTNLGPRYTPLEVLELLASCFDSRHDDLRGWAIEQARDLGDPSLFTPLVARGRTIAELPGKGEERERVLAALRTIARANGALVRVNPDVRFEKAQLIPPWGSLDAKPFPALIADLERWLEQVQTRLPPQVRARR